MRKSAKGPIWLAVAGIGALILGTAAAAQSTDPIIGTWTLDVAKSTYKPGPAPKSATVTIEPAGKGIKVGIDAVNPDGKPMKWGFTTMRDGKDVPVTGNPAYDMAASTSPTPTTGTTEFKKGGKVIMTSKLSISADGKTMTINGSGTDPKGQPASYTAVYTKK
jgi:hypothetical protein